MPPARRTRRIHLYRVEEQLCLAMKHSQDWLPKNQILEQMTRFQSGLSPRSRVLSNIFNPKQYKVLKISVPFLCPFQLMYRKKVAFVMYRMNLRPTNETESARHRILPLLTCFSLWNYVLDRPYQLVQSNVGPLHALFPQWSVEDWLSTLEKLDYVFKQINDTNALKAEMKRIQHTDASHYPWWREDDSLRIVHAELDLKLKPLELGELTARPPLLSSSSPLSTFSSSLSSPLLFSSSSPIANIEPFSETKSLLFDPYPHVPPPLLVYLQVPLSFSDQMELLELSHQLFHYFRKYISMADIQWQVWMCNMDPDQSKLKLEQFYRVHSNATNEQFPNQYELLRSHFHGRTPKPSNEQLFQLWQQAQGNWDIINNI